METPKWTAIDCPKVVRPSASSRLMWPRSFVKLAMIPSCPEKNERSPLYRIKLDLQWSTELYPNHHKSTWFGVTSFTSVASCRMPSHGMASGRHGMVFQRCHLVPFGRRLPNKRSDWKIWSGWWFGCHFLFSHILGIIIPIDVHIFQRGSNHQPVIRWYGSENAAYPPLMATFYIILEGK